MSQKVALTDPDDIVAAVKDLLGPPALLSTESEDAYFKLLKALAEGFAVRNAFDLMQLHDMTYSEVRKSFLRKQQSILLDQVRRDHALQAAQRRSTEAEKKREEESNKEVIEELKQAKPELQTQLQRELVVDTGLDDVKSLLKFNEEDLEHARALKANVGYYGAIDGFISTEKARRNECAGWLELRGSLDPGSKGVAVVDRPVDQEQPSANTVAELVPPQEPPQ